LIGAYGGAGGQGQLWLRQREARRGKYAINHTALAPVRRLLQPNRRQAVAGCGIRRAAMRGSACKVM
jgi:hypothetical protein